jgi:hypothetical protein
VKKDIEWVVQDVQCILDPGVSSCVILVERSDREREEANGYITVKL